MFRRLRVTNRFFVLFVLLFVLALGASASPADARFASCRVDPVVFLSNGDQVQLVASTETAESNVKVINYALHAPPGVTVLKVLYTGGPFSGKETFKFYNDASPNHYTTDTMVTTRVSGVKVTATTSLRATGISGSATGYERQHLQVTIVK